MSFPKYPNYKPSDVEWLGEVPEHWETVPVKRNFKIIGGSTPKAENEAFWDGGIPWATPADLSKRRSLNIDSTQRTISSLGLASCGTTLVPPGAIILSTRAPIGSLAIARTNMCTNQGCKSLVPIRGTSSKFFAYLLCICTKELNIRGKGTTFLELSSDELGGIKIPMPPLSEQLQIEVFLDRETAKIDALISEQERLIALLKEKRQAVISHAVTKGLNPGAPTKPSGFEWLGDVPEQWTVRRLGSLSTKITNGYVGPTRDILMENGVRYLQSLHIKRNTIRFDVPYFVSLEWSNKHEKSILETGDVLIVQTGDIGQVAVVTDEFKNCNCHALIIVSPLRSLLSGHWIAWVLNSEYGFNSLLSIQTGALHPHLNCGDVKDLSIPLPSIGEQQQIGAYITEKCRKLDFLMVETQHAIDLLHERRTALISAAVTGKIDVRPISDSQAA